MCRYQVEVSDHEAVEKAVGQTLEDFGRIDCFVANAGMAISKPILEQTVEEYRTQYKVNGELLRNRDCHEVEYD